MATTLRSCGACHGSGHVSWHSGPCPYCNGAGFYEVAPVFTERQMAEERCTLTPAMIILGGMTMTNQSQKEAEWLQNLTETEKKMLASARRYATEGDYPEVAAHYKKLIAKLADLLDQADRDLADALEE